VNIQKLDLDGEKAQILTTGKVDLPRWQLATKHKITAKTKPDVPPFDMAFSGSLDNPGQTFGQGLLNDYLKRKVDRKINKLLSDKLGDKLGIPLGGAQQQQQAPTPAPTPTPAEVAPAGGVTPQEQNPVEPAPPQEELKPEDAIKDVLKGLLE
jgi:hypothetical protein